MDAENSDTPRTDTFEKQRIVEASTNDIATEAWADFARQLERELNELRRQNEMLLDLLEQTRHYSIGPGMPNSWFMERDKALAAQPEEAK